MPFKVAAILAFVLWVVVVLGSFIYAFSKLKREFPNLKWRDFGENEAVSRYFKRVMKWPSVLIFSTFFIIIIFILIVGILNSD